MMVLSADPGIANFGWSVLSCDGMAEKPLLVACGLFQTERDPSASKGENLHRRFERLWLDFTKVFETYRPGLVACEEVMQLRTNAGSQKLAYACSVFDGLCVSRKHPCVWMRPPVWRGFLKIAKDKAATEDYVRSFIAGAAAINDFKKTDRHHVTDAIAIGAAAAETEIFKLVKGMKVERKKNAKPKRAAKS